MALYASEMRGLTRFSLGGTVQRPLPPSVWDGPFAIYGVRIGDAEISRGRWSSR
jgi:hypothetical protein